jgi:DNA-binding PadR family transcriptional regulator
MEIDGLVVSTWDPSPAGPARRTSRVTPEGEEWAARVTAGLREADRHMARWLARYNALARRGGPKSRPGIQAAS